MNGNSSRPGRGGRRLPSAPGGADLVEHIRRQVDRLCWTGILLGLAFTMTNVQGFAAAGARTWSLTWLVAWLLDPMVSIVLLAILRAEQLIARHGVYAGGWVRAAKWFTLAATYVMNTWAAYASGSAALVVLHSVPPLVVFVATEAVTDLRGKLAETSPFMNDPKQPSAQQRTSFDQYMRRAQDAWRRGTAVTPAWIREVTGCSRGVSSRLAAAFTNDVATTKARS